jgi:hypothetical protein
MSNNLLDICAAALKSHGICLRRIEGRRARPPSVHSLSIQCQSLALRLDAETSLISQACAWKSTVPKSD